MKKLLTIILVVALSATVVQAKDSTSRASTHVEATKSGLFTKLHESDGYTIRIYSDKPLVVGNNTIAVVLKKGDNAVTDAKVKIKFFMPEMPGMPSMEYKEKFKLDNKSNSYKGVVNISMSGTWQYQLKFKTADGKVHKARGSVNL